MKRRSAIATALAAVLAGCGGKQPAAEARPRWAALPVQDLSGRPATVAVVDGRPHVINMWALWCPPCREELPALQRLAEVLAPRGMDVSAVALAEEIFPVREYLLQVARNLPAAVMSGKLPVVQELGLNALPQTFLVQSDGSIAAVWVGARDWDAPQVRTELERTLRGSAA